MVYLTRRKKKGKVYLYLEQSARINGKPRRVWQKYLGPEDRLQELTFTGLFTKHHTNVIVSTLEFGASAALWKIANEIGLDIIIDRHTSKNRAQGLSVGEYLTIAAINRCVKPSSKSKLGDWFEQDWISTKYEITPEKLTSQSFWNHIQYIDEQKIAEIETAINKVVLKQYNLEMNNLFYDPTNFYTYSEGTGEEGILQFGHSKENRNGKRLVNYTLLCARDSGVPIMHKTYAGNIQDANRFKSTPDEILSRIRKLNLDPKTVTIVFDKGNHSKDAFIALDSTNFGFIASARDSTQKDLLQIPSSNLTTTILPVSGKTVQYHTEKRIIYNKERTIYVILDPKKQKKHRTHFEEKLLEKIAEIQDWFQIRLNVKKWRSFNAVEEKIKKMIGRNPFKSVLRYQIVGSDGNLEYKLSINSDALSNHVETLGKTILFTNHHDWSPESVIWGYREQYIVEHAFRQMKSPTSIQIRPMFHYTDKSIRVHVFICVLALLLLSLLRLSLSRNKLVMSYGDLLDHLNTIHILKIQTSETGTPLWKLANCSEIPKKMVKSLDLKSLI